MRQNLFGAVAAGIAATLTASAGANIVITEIWSGGLAGAESTSDWIEISNFGAMAVTGVDTWFFEDDSANPLVAGAITGITSIAPGESVIVMTDWDDFGDEIGAQAAFENTWGASNLVGVQFGFVQGGPGLGNSGDTVYLYDSNIAGAGVIATQGYPSAGIEESFIWNPNTMSWNNEVAVAGVFGAFASVLPASDGAGVGPAIGSPGVVPTPGAAAILGLAGLRRRR